MRIRVITTLLARDGDSGEPMLWPSIDHLIPRSHRGSDFYPNLAVAHRYCNEYRNTDPITDEPSG